MFFFLFVCNVQLKFSLAFYTVFILLTFSGIRLFEGFNISMTITSAGGFLPTNFLGDIIKLENQKVIFSICMLIPLFNLYLIYNIFSNSQN